MSLFDEVLEETSLVEAQGKGQRAGQLLRDEVFLSVLDDVEMNVLTAWRDAQSVEARERCHAQLFGLAEVRRVLAAYEGDGKVAEHKIEQQELEVE